eukprot:scaffold311949_cov18-Prasinocladus_malaysianus.AAC.1
MPKKCITLWRAWQLIDLEIMPGCCSFERGRKDTFNIRGMDIGELTHVVIKHDNTGAGAAWHLEQ